MQDKGKLLSYLILNLVCVASYATDPSLYKTPATQSVNVKQVAPLSHTSILLRSTAVANNTTQLSDLRLVLSGNTDLQSATATPVAKGVRTTNHVLDMLSIASSRQEPLAVLNMNRPHPVTNNAAIGIINFVNTLSHLSAHYALGSHCIFYSKFIITSRTANIGLNF